MQTPTYSLAELADQFDLTLHGDGNIVVDGVGTLQGGGAGKISFLANAKYRRYLGDTQVSAIILGEKDLSVCETNALVAVNPYASYARIAALFAPRFIPESGVHRSAVVDPTAVLKSGVSIGPNSVVAAGVVLQAGVEIGPGCVIDANVQIGANTRLTANITVCHSCQIGERVLIHPGVVIGADGFGIAPDQGEWVKVPQLGRVMIGDGVEIGANTTIDRGALEDTVIEDGVQIDNQVQVAHNVVIGKNTAIAGCVGIAGSVKIGRDCLIGGAVDITGHLQIADGVTLAATSCVTKSITEAGVYSSASPVQPVRDWNKNLARLRKLEQLQRRIAALEK